MNNLEIDIRKYNNKSRKGKYIVIKSGRESRTYKYDEQFPIDFYVEVANRSFENKIQGLKRKKPHKKKIMTELEEVIKGKESQYLQRMGIKYAKYKGIKPDNYFKRGQQRIKVELQQLRNDPMKYYKKLLRPLVLDDDLLKIVVQNADKFRHRFWYYAETKGLKINNKDKKVTNLSYHEDRMKTPEEIINQYKERFKTNRFVNGGMLSRLIKEVGGINERYYITNSKERLLLKKTYITIVFTKGEKPERTKLKRNL